MSALSATDVIARLQEDNRIQEMLDAIHRAMTEIIPTTNTSTPSWIQTALEKLNEAFQACDRLSESELLSLARPNCTNPRTPNGMFCLMAIGFFLARQKYLPTGGKQGQASQNQTF